MKRFSFLVFNLLYFFSVAFQNNILSIRCEASSIASDGGFFFSEILKPLFYNENLDSLFNILNSFFSYKKSSREQENTDGARITDTNISYSTTRIKGDLDSTTTVKDDLDSTTTIKDDKSNDDQSTTFKDDISNEDQNTTTKDDLNTNVSDREQEGYAVSIDIERDDAMSARYNETIDEISELDDESEMQFNSNFWNTQNVIWNWCGEPSAYFTDIKVDMTPEVLVSGQDVTANLHGNLLKDLPTLTLDTRIQYNMFPAVRFFKDLCEEHAIECPVSSGVQTHKLTYHIPPLLSGRIKIEAKLLTGTEEIACIIIGPLRVTH